MLMIFAVVLCYLSSSERRPERDSNPDLCDAGAVLDQISYQANWEMVIMWVYDEPVDSGYLVEHCIGIAEVRVRVPFRPFFLYCVSSIAKLRRSLTLKNRRIMFIKEVSGKKKD